MKDSYAIDAKEDEMRKHFICISLNYSSFLKKE